MIISNIEIVQFNDELYLINFNDTNGTVLSVGNDWAKIKVKPTHKRPKRSTIINPGERIIGV